MHLFGSRGLPDSIRRVTGFGVHAFKLVGPDGRFRYCKFHFRPVNSPTHFSGKQATRMASLNADFHAQDLWDAISRRQYPAWMLYVQVLEPEQAETLGGALFDITKVWPHKEYPLIEVGRMTLNENVRSRCSNTKFDYSLNYLSRRITLRRSNKLHSHLPTWFP